MPLSEKSSVISRVTPPMPAMMPAASPTRLTGSPKSTRFSTQILAPMQADHAVEDDGDPAEHPTGGGAHDRAELGAQAEQDRDRGGHVVGGRRVDLGGAHDADVLGVRRGRRPAERAGQRGGEAVGADGPAHVGVEARAGHLADRLDVTGVLGEQRDDARQDQQDEGQREAGPVDDGHPVGEVTAREADPVRGLDAGPVDPVVGHGGRWRRGSTEVICPKTLSKSHEST